MNNINMNTFIEDLASEKPAPGGGSCSALFATLSCALSSMVCALTINNQKYIKEHNFVKEKHNKIQEMQKKAIILINKDIEAFNAISHAYKMPKNTNNEKTQRSIAIQTALLPAIQVPYEIIELCADGIDTIDLLLEKSNPNVISDLACAVIGFKAAMRSAWINVLINLKSLKDNNNNFKENAEKIIKNYTQRADIIYSKITETITK